MIAICKTLFINDNVQKALNLLMLAIVKYLLFHVKQALDFKIMKRDRQEHENHKTDSDRELEKAIACSYDSSDKKYAEPLIEFLRADSFSQIDSFLQ